MAVELRRKKNIYVSRNPTDPIFIVPTLIFLRFLSMLFLWSNDKLALKHCRIDKCVQRKKIADLPTLPFKPCFRERRLFYTLTSKLLYISVETNQTISEKVELEESESYFFVYRSAAKRTQIRPKRGCIPDSPWIRHWLRSTRTATSVAYVISIRCSVFTPARHT